MNNNPVPRAKAFPRPDTTPTGGALAAAAPRPPLTLRSLWRNLALRNAVYQVAAVILVLATVGYMMSNAQIALENRGISGGFDFLTDEAAFEIGDKMISYSPTESYLKAYLVGILNSLKLSFFCILGATLLGILVGIARLSGNFFVKHAASLYVEVFRNVPLLIQIIFWYTLMTRLPHPREAWDALDLAFVSNRGLFLAWPQEHPANGMVLAATLAAGAAAFTLARWADRRRRRTGKRFAILWWNLALLVGLPLGVWTVFGMPMEIDVPRLSGFNFSGGLSLSTEFLALLLGLSLYTSAFIGEIVRAGIQSVPKGQIEAVRTIGLGPIDLYRKVILPQALRVIIPPAGSQYVSQVKNTSLGIAIGYPELFSVNNTILTISGKTLECVGIMMAVYLTFSFSISALINLYNKTVQIKER